MAIKGYLIFTVTVVGTLAVLMAMSTDNSAVALGCAVAAGLSFFAGIRVGDLPDGEF